MRFWLFLMVLGCGNGVPLDPDAGERDVGGDPLLDVDNWRTESDCACVSAHTLHAEVGCTFTIEADATTWEGEPYSGSVTFFLPFWDDGMTETAVAVDGLLSWTHTVTSEVDREIERGESYGHISVSSGTFGHVLYGHPVTPREGGPYLLCAYWTDIDDVAIPQFRGWFGVGCGGAVSLGTRVGLHAEIRGAGEASVIALIREDDGGLDDSIAQLPLEFESGSTTEIWTSTFPDPRDGVGTAEVYFRLELRDDPDAEEPDDVMRTGNFCLTP